MQELQPHSSSEAQPVTLPAWTDSEDHDLALGCECANPALQIERWGEELRAAAQG